MALYPDFAHQRFKSGFHARIGMIGYAVFYWEVDDENKNSEAFDWQYSLTGSCRRGQSL